MYLNKYCNSYKRRYEHLTIIYASKAVANTLINLDVDLDNLANANLEKELSIPEIEGYLNEIATIKKVITLPRSSEILEPLKGIPGKPMEIKVETPSIFSITDMTSSRSIKQMIRGLFNIYTDGSVVIIYPNDSLASVLTKIHLTSLPVVLYACIANHLQDPSVLKHFDRCIKNQVLRSLLIKVS